MREPTYSPFFLRPGEPQVTTDSTITSVSIDRGRTRDEETAHDQLILLASSEDPRMPSSRHVLDGIDEVRFGRGERQIRRHVEGSLHVLSIQLPDRRVSTQHGCLRRVASGWMIDDPRSRNGIVVNGTLTRRASVGDDALIELGHTFLLLRSGPLEEDPPLDVDETALRAPTPALATFEGELARRFSALSRIARSATVVLLLGETGTGKEVVANAIHSLSGRAGPFKGVNCGAIPAGLVEAELFGVKKGGFTGAVADRPGFVRSAEGGTLLLDEVAELPTASQAALLRAISTRTVTPVGDDRDIAFDARICAATLRDIDALIASGAFRQDLYARLAGFVVKLPALRERRADLGLLMRARLATIPGGDRVAFTPAALRTLFRHDWPLNIRELDSVLQRAVALAPDGVIDVPHLELARPAPPAPRARRTTAPPIVPSAPGTPLADDRAPDGGGNAAPAATRPAPPAHAPPAPASLRPLTPDDLALRERLVALLTEHRGNVVVVARAMGVRRMQVYRWAARFGLDLDSFRR